MVLDNGMRPNSYRHDLAHADSAGATGGSGRNQSRYCLNFGPSWASLVLKFEPGRSPRPLQVDALSEHWSEQRALWAVRGQLERVLVEPFDPNYKELLRAARERTVTDIAESDRKRVR